MLFCRIALIALQNIYKKLITTAGRKQQRKAGLSTFDKKQASTMTYKRL